MVEKVASMLLLLVLLCASVLQHRALGDEVTTCKCVKPAVYKTESNPCLNGECFPLMHYAKFQDNFVSNTVFKFLPGNHDLSGVLIKVSDIVNLKLVGYIESGDRYEENTLPMVQCIGNPTGFLFENVTNLSIVHLGFQNCGFHYYKNYHQALLMKTVTNMQLSGVLIYNTSGYGLSTYQLHGHSVIHSTIIDSSHNTTGCRGGNLQIVDFMNSGSNDSHSLLITDSLFQNGSLSPKCTCSKHYYASGIGIFLGTTDSIHITLRNVTLTRNQACSGGNLAISYVRLSTYWSSLVTLDNCTLSWGSALLGGGMYMSVVARQRKSTLSHDSNGILSINDTHFENNKADIVGGGAYLQFHEDVELSTGAKIIIKNSKFVNNSVQQLQHGRGGVALSVLNFQIAGYLPHKMLQYNLSLISCHFTHNRVIISRNDSVGSGTLFVEGNAVTHLRDNVIAHNHCTGVVAVRSNLILEGNNTIAHNIGNNGGGILLCDNSIIYLSGTVYVNITQNHALSFGGGIYTEFECTQAIPPCFFQYDHQENKAIHMDRNVAIAGSALYGGSVDYCYFFGKHFRQTNSTEIFFDLFHFTKKDRSYITSTPLQVCFCNMDSQGTLNPDCSEHERVYSIYPGSEFTVPLVTVGQRRGTVPGVIIASNVTNETATQSIKGTSCKHLSYSISHKAMTSTSFHQNRTVNIDLKVQNTDFKDVFDSFQTVTVYVQFKTCPVGFQLRDNCTTNDRCGCICLNNIWQYLHRIECIIKRTTIHKEYNSLSWLGFKTTNNETDIVFTQFCPFDFCDVKHSHNIDVTQPETANRQCAFNRAGILCGGCQGNLSKVFGSSSCADCARSYSVLRAIGLVVAFAIAGIVLVIFLGVFRMTVTEGTLNVIIFYMNLVRVNNSIFIGPPKGFFVKLLTGFVSWMNLDLGIEVCFYDGMTAFEKTLFQFLFPLYLWFLAGMIILLCRKSSLVSRLVGENAVKLLATIILLSYAKFFRTTIDVFHLTTLSYGSGSTYVHVWTMDGNIQYLGTKHAILLALGVIVVAVTIPYTLALLFIQCLRKIPNMKMLFWVNKLKPFFDAYTGPYKDRYHFWTGFLLIVRIGLFIGFAMNTSRGPIVNLALVGGITSLLTLLIQPSIYRKWPLSVIEAFSYFNLIVYSFMTAYTTHFQCDKTIPTLLCVGSMFLLFFGVVLYHVYKRLSDTQRFMIMKVWLLDKRWPWMKKKPIRSLVLPYIDPDNIDELTCSELDPLLMNAPPLARYDEYREPLIETGEDT